MPFFKKIKLFCGDLIYGFKIQGSTFGVCFILIGVDQGEKMVSVGIQSSFRMFLESRFEVIHLLKNLRFLEQMGWSQIRSNLISVTSLVLNQAGFDFRSR